MKKSPYNSILMILVSLIYSGIGILSLVYSNESPNTWSYYILRIVVLLALIIYTFTIKAELNRLNKLK